MTKNKFEQKINDDLLAKGIRPRYESETFLYRVERKHTPDFAVAGRSIIIEAKGQFKSEDRTKIKAVLKYNPNVDYRIVFQNAYTKLRKGSTSTYADWCNSHNIKWSHKDIPDQWIKDIKQKLRELYPSEYQ